MSKVPEKSTTAEKVVANFNLATSQLVDLLTECKESNKRSTDTGARMNAVEDRITTLESKVSLPHPPQPPSHLIATTADLGKAMSTCEASCTSQISSNVAMMKDMVAKEVAALRKEMAADREFLAREMFKSSNTPDVLKSLVTAALKGIVALLKQLEGDVGAINTCEVTKK